MAKLNLAQQNFTAGEISPLVWGRSDYAKFYNGVKEMTNFFPLSQGAAINSPGTVWQADIDATDLPSRLIPFDREGGSYILLLKKTGTSTTAFDIYKSGVLVASSVSAPWTPAQIFEVRFAQQGDSMIFSHSAHPPHSVVWISDSVWRSKQFIPGQPPTSDYPYATTGTVSLSATSGTITFTSTASDFLPGDVGRIIQAGTGAATISSYTSGTEVVGTSLATFNASSYATGMTVEGTLSADISYAGTNSVGATLTLTATQGVFRSGDSGKYIYANNGVLLIKTYSSATSITAQVKRKLDNLTATPSGGWTLEQSAWTATNGYPTACGFHGGRLWFGGTTTKPTSLWGSAVNDYNDYATSTLDDGAMSYPIGSDRNDAIQHIASSRNLVIFTRSAEYQLVGQSNGALTPTGTAIRNESSFGSGTVGPEYLEGQVIFAQRGQKKIRSMSYESDSAVAAELSKISEHILKEGVHDMAVTHEPYASLWCVMNNGDMVTCTVDVAETVAAWSRRTVTNGEVRSVAAVSENGTDVVYLLIYRNKTGTNALTLERFDFNQPLDYACTFTGPGTVFNVSARYGNGADLAVIADGVYLRQYTVTGGNITLDTSADEITVGYNFTGRIKLLPPELTLRDGLMHGRRARCSNVVLYLYDTPAITVNGEKWENRIADIDRFDDAAGGYTGFTREFPLLGRQRGGNEVVIEREAPNRCTILTVGRQVEVE